MNTHATNEGSIVTAMRPIVAAVAIVALVCVTVLLLASIRAGGLRAFLRAPDLVLGVELDPNPPGATQPR